MSESTQNHFAFRLHAWFWQRRHNALILGIVALLVMIQWPMVKGVFYRVIGAPFPADNIAWRTLFKPALEESARTGKPVLLDFSASWCPPCQVMKREVWPDTEVGDLVASSFIPVLLDADEPANQEVASAYGVETIPTIIVVDSKGTILKKADYLSRDGMVKFLKSIASERKTS